MSQFDAQTLRRAFGSFMTGVTVVTARSDSGELAGFTANSFTSVSIDPPLLLVCPGNHLSSFGLFNTVRHFGVSILAEGQEAVSNEFASSVDDRFDNTPWHQGMHGVPLIDGAVATFSCRVHQRHVAGDHLVLVGEVLALSGSNRQGLGYCSNGYFSLSKEQQADAPGLAGYESVAGAIVECNGRILVATDNDGASLPCIAQTAGSGARSSLQKHFHALGLTVDLGPVYSVYEDSTRQKRYTYIRARATTADTGELGSFETIESLKNLPFNDHALATMMARFVAESRIRQFGLYVGSAESGEIHPLAEKQD